jgi:hypothetical protein
MPEIEKEGETTKAVEMRWRCDLLLLYYLGVVQIPVTGDKLVVDMGLCIIVNNGWQNSFVAFSNRVSL